MNVCLGGDLESRGRIQGVNRFASSFLEASGIHQILVASRDTIKYQILLQNQKPATKLFFNLLFVSYLVRDVGKQLWHFDVFWLLQGIGIVPKLHEERYVITLLSINILRRPLIWKTKMCTVRILLSPCELWVHVALKSTNQCSSNLMPICNIWNLLYWGEEI